MLSGWLLVLLALTYVGVLFAIAYFGDKQAMRTLPGRPKPIVYSLTIAVLCTSWGFYGAVGQAATSGWVTSPPLGNPLLVVPTYIGHFLLFLLGWRFFDKLVRISKKQHINSIADFIAARYGKSQTLAVAAALIAVVGVIPYIALQLKAISITYQVVTATPGIATVGHNVPMWEDTALYVTLLLALFSILFGTRHIDATEHHEGMMLAIAFESLVKLLCFVAVGVFVTYGMFDGFGDIAHRIASNPELGELYHSVAGQHQFLTQVVMGALVLFCLPRQFHVTVVENSNARDVRTARWMFPLYLFAINAFVYPIAAAGLLTFAPGHVNADTFVLTLPMAAGRHDLATVAFLGGFSAGTGMVIVATLALSIMVCNDVVMPLLLRWNPLGLSQRKDVSRLLLYIRRIAITGILLLAYMYYRMIAEFAALASFGILAFAAVSQFAPAIIAGMYWKRANRRGVLVGLAAGFVLWAYTLLVPTLASSGWIPYSLLQHGPLGIEWLKPTALFGVFHFDTTTHGLLWSLLVNSLCLVVFSLVGRQRLVERTQGTAFVDMPTLEEAGHILRNRSAATVEDLQMLAGRFIGEERARGAFAAYGVERRRSLSPAESAEPALIALTERLMASVIGASSARMVLASALRGGDMQLEEVATIVGETSQALQFNRELLQATIESVSQGIRVVDRDQRIVAWNQRYLEIFGYPPGFVRVGLPLAEVVRYNSRHGEYGLESEDPLADASARIAAVKRGEPYGYQRTRPDGTVLEIRGNPMPGGGFVTTFTDITEHKKIEQALRESEQNIRVYTDNVPVLIAYIDSDQRFRFTNRAYERAWRLKREDIYGRTVKELFSGEFYHDRLPYMDQALAGRPQSFETYLPTPDGTIRHALGTYIPDFGRDGEVVGLFALFQDITERVEAERALKEANETLEQRVQERTHALTQANEALRRENAVRAEVETALRQAKGEAEQANLSKTRFLAAASHDLLQPLNAAGLFVSALEQRDFTPQDRQLIGHIGSALRSAEGLLSELLDISKLDAGALQPEIEEFAIDDVLSALDVEFTALARERELGFRRIRCGRYVRSDPALLRRVLQNFLSNAIRYTDKGRVLLGCRVRGDRLSIQVWDTGPGIPEHQRKKIFEEFHRLSHQDPRGEKCLGLGLAIVDRIARMLGHPIAVRSTPHRGTMFSVDVPLGVPNAARQRTAAVRPAKSAEALKGVRILCIDNDAAILEGMTALLRGWNCDVITADSEASAREALAKVGRRVDIMLADYHLDDQDTGLAVMERLQGLWAKPVPGVLVTADHNNELREHTLELGYQYLRKPLKPAGLRAMLNKLLSSRAA